MPPSISALLIQKRGIGALTLPQLNRLYENRTEVEKILTQFEELRDKVLVSEKAAQQTITEAESRLAEVAVAEETLAEHTAEAEAVNISRVAETEALRKSLDERAEKLAGEIAAHEGMIAEAHAAERTALHSERRRLTEAFGKVKTIIDCFDSPPAAG